MFGVGTGEIILIMVIAMLVVGPERMVSFARTAGSMLAKFRLETNAVTSEFKEALDLEPITDAMNTAKEAAAEVQESLESTRDIAKGAATEVQESLEATRDIATGEMASAEAVVKDAAATIPSASVAPPASAFADSQVSRRTSRSAPSSPPDDASTSLAGPQVAEEQAQDGEDEDVYEVTVLDGPEEYQDEAEATSSSVLGEG